MAATHKEEETGRFSWAQLLRGPETETSLQGPLSLKRRGCRFLLKVRNAEVSGLLTAGERRMAVFFSSDV